MIVNTGPKSHCIRYSIDSLQFLGKLAIPAMNSMCGARRSARKKKLHPESRDPPKLDIRKIEKAGET